MTIACEAANLRYAVQYLLQHVDELLATACKETVAVVQPRSDETVYHSDSCTPRKCTSTALYITQTAVAASGQLIVVGRE